MENEKTEKKKKKGRKIAVILILIAAALALFGFFSFRSRLKDTAADESDIAKVERRTVVNSVSANGTIVSTESHEVTASGMLAQKVLSVAVVPGDRVNEGDTICIFDTSSLESQKESLNGQIAKTEQDKAARAAQAEADAAKSESDRQASIASVQESLLAAGNALDQAKQDAADAQSQYDAYIAGGGGENDAAAAVLKAVLSGRNAAVTAAQTTVDSLSDQLTSLQNPSSSTGILLDTYNATMDAMISTLKDSVAAIDARIAGAVVTAPAAGLVTEVDAKAGETYTGGTLALVELDNSLMVEAEVGEYDIPDVAVGMRVVVKTDATRDEELSGHVTYVAPKPESGSSSGLSGLSGLLSGGSSLDISSLTGASSSASYKVRIALDDTNDRLRLGMNARASIVTEEAENALTVPYDAVQEDADGNNYVEVPEYVEDSRGKKTMKEKKVSVTKGLEGTYYIELTSDTLKEGDEVIVPKSDTGESVDDILSIMGSGAGM